MDEALAVLVNEARYAERLCQRTARLYRRLQTSATFIGVVSGSATLTALAPTFPPWVSLAGGAFLALTAAFMLSVRPAEKAIANEADVKRYAEVLTLAATSDAVTLRTALAKARETNAPEVETLRDVAYNDVVLEAGRDDQAIKLGPMQRILAVLA